MNATVLQLRIRGVVQGVGYRWAMAQEARRLGVAGWVRNRHDGSVEVVAEGPRPALDTLLAYCAKGPPGAVVREVGVSDEEETAEFDSFGFRSDA